MKKRITLIAVLFVTSYAFSQQIGDEGYSPIIKDFTIPLKSGVYSGLGATGGTPDSSNDWSHLFVVRHNNQTNNYQLQIASSYTENDRLFFRKIAYNWGLLPKNTAWFELATRGSNTFTGSQMINGDVGIGSALSLAKLDVSGNLILRNYENIKGKGSNIIFTAYGDILYGPQIRSYLTFASGADSNMGLILSSYCGSYKDELFLYDGRVGIGTKNPRNALDVKGTIHSQEVKVDMEGWSDFVFKKEYNLPTLAEVEKHINEKGHLENIPNEEEVLKNGINLGEMNARLLQKIEELTLYTIQQSKEIKILKEENNSFKSLNERVSKMEKLLK
jgi:hypothetical protein